MNFGTSFLQSVPTDLDTLSSCPGASKVFADEAKEMAENDKKIKKFVINEYGEAVRAA